MQNDFISNIHSDDNDVVILFNDYNSSDDVVINFHECQSFTSTNNDIFELQQLITTATNEKFSSKGYISIVYNRHRGHLSVLSINFRCSTFCQIKKDQPWKYKFKFFEVY